MLVRYTPAATMVMMAMMAGRLSSTTRIVACSVEPPDEPLSTLYPGVPADFFLPDGRVGAVPPEKVAAYQRAVEKHRRDLVYEVPGSRVGSNMLGEIKHACFSDRTKARMAQKQTCGANASWPYPIKNASAAVETPADEPAGAEEP